MSAGVVIDMQRQWNRRQFMFPRVRRPRISRVGKMSGVAKLKLTGLFQKGLFARPAATLPPRQNGTN